jgi:transposase-like protein
MPFVNPTIYRRWPDHLFTVHRGFVSVWFKKATELRNRGCQDILIAVVDGLKGFPEAITTVFPRTVVQTCIVHLIRYSMHFASWKERRPVAAALKPVYQAESAAAARERLEEFDRGPWGKKYPAIAQSWRRNWEQVIPFFAFAPELRKIMYTTNAIESLNAQVRKAVESAAILPARRRPPSSFGWCCAMFRRAGKIRRSRGKLRKPNWRSSSRTDSC